jgi:NMD protein affecting ribosome stability and mRNA decay
VPIAYNAYAGVAWVKEVFRHKLHQHNWVLAGDEVNVFIHCSRCGIRWPTEPWDPASIEKEVRAQMEKEARDAQQKPR